MGICHLSSNIDIFPQQDRCNHHTLTGISKKIVENKYMPEKQQI
jgi:hypothetical protein